MKKILAPMLFLTAPAFSNSLQPHMALIDAAHIESDDTDSTGELFRLQLPIKNGIYLNYERLSLDGDVPESKSTTTAVGAGFFWSTSPNSKMYLGYSKVDLELGGLGTEDLTRYELGWRKRVSQRFELKLEYNQTDFTDPGIDDGGYKIGLDFYATPTFAITLGADHWYEQDRLLLGVRFTSGR